LQISNVTEKIRNRAYGLFGGEPGASASLTILDAMGKERHTPPKGLDRLMPGEEIVMRLPGGGGYGPASEREASSCEEDRRLGYL
jgi:N-methylhydantoinase B